MMMNYVVLVIIKGLKENNMKCSICNYNDIGEYGHNAQPVNNGRCCGYCNGAFVMPKRLKQFTLREKS